jgi:hypothetical protein
MNKPVIAISALLLFSACIVSCSKKSSPSKPSVVILKSGDEKGTEANAPTAATAETAAVKKPVVKTTVPKVIVVNDKAAKRSVDGRYYYDLDGRRYWRNNRDGKYYLFNKSMYDNPDFKAPPKT